MLIYFPPVLVNQAGETALDIAKRLKATQCEDLVSKTELGHPLGTSCLKMSFSETGIGINRFIFPNTG